MKAIRIHEYGDVDVLRYEDVERPTPGPGQVLIHVAAAGFNPVDTWFRAGTSIRSFPFASPIPLALTLPVRLLNWGRTSKFRRSGVSHRISSND